MAFAVISAARHPLVPFGVSLTRLQDSLHAAGWTVAPPKGALDAALQHRAFPPALAACYRASWQLPGPDFHRLADTDLRVDHLNVTTSWSSLCTHAAGHTKVGLDGDLAKAEPKTLRYRVLNAAARLVRGGRRRRWKIAANWPWAEPIARAWQRICALAGTS